MTPHFEGKSVVVTGAASGIGRAAARLFAAEGARVLAADLSEDIERIADAIAFLASPEAAYVNGHALVVDGGLSSSHPVN